MRYRYVVEDVWDATGPVSESAHADACDRAQDWLERNADGYEIEVMPAGRNLLPGLYRNGYIVRETPPALDSLLGCALEHALSTWPGDEG